MRRGASIFGWLLAASFVLLLITGTNLYLISKLGNQTNRQVNIPTESPSPSISVNLRNNRSSEEIKIIPQNPLVKSFGTVELVLLQNLTLEKYEVNGSMATLYLKYWFNNRLHSLKLEARTQFGTDKGVDKITDGVFGTKYKIGDRLNIALSYVSSQNYSAVNSKKIRETIAADSRLKADLADMYGSFGDDPISLDQLKTALQNDEASFDSATVMVETITAADSKP